MARPLEEHVRAEHVGPDEVARGENGAVDMSLRGEVHDRGASLARRGDGGRVRMSP